jgi:hypothetical protein
MDIKFCRTLRIEFPLLAFSHCRDVASSFSRPGVFEVFGASGWAPEQLETEPAWINAGVDGRPYCPDLPGPRTYPSAPAPAPLSAIWSPGCRTSTAPSSTTCHTGATESRQGATGNAKTRIGRRPINLGPASG